jgi:hypothetical protein
MPRDLAHWVLTIWRKRGLISDRAGVIDWLKTQDRERLERLKASGKPVYSQRELDDAKRGAAHG